MVWIWLIREMGAPVLVSHPQGDTLGWVTPTCQQMCQPNSAAYGDTNSRGWQWQDLVPQVAAAEVLLISHIVTHDTVICHVIFSCLFTQRKRKKKRNFQLIICSIVSFHSE